MTAPSDLPSLISEGRRLIEEATKGRHKRMLLAGRAQLVAALWLLFLAGARMEQQNYGHMGMDLAVATFFALTGIQKIRVALDAALRGEVRP